MEKCEIEFTEGFNMESEEVSVSKLGKHLGKLLVILELAGIPINERRTGSRLGYLLDLFRKSFFPIFLHLSCLFLLYDRMINGGFNYGTVIDTVLPILPCVMWIMMRCQNVSLKSLLTDLSRITSSNFQSRNRTLSYTTNAALCFVFIYPILLLAMRFAQGNIVNAVEIFRILQEAIFPITMAIVYVSMCYLLLQKLQSCKKMFCKRLDLTCSAALDMMKDYVNVIKSVENFENLLCNIAFVVLLHDLLIVSILVIDMIYVENWVPILLFEALCELLYIFFSLVIMAVCAGNVSSEMTEIKSVVFEKAFTQLDQGDLTNNEKHVNLLLKKDVCVLTVGKALVFNRGLILKVLLVVFAEVVIICEVGPLLNH